MTHLTGTLRDFVSDVAGALRTGWTAAWDDFAGSRMCRAEADEHYAEQERIAQRDTDEDYAEAYADVAGDATLAHLLDDGADPRDILRRVREEACAKAGVTRP